MARMYERRFYDGVSCEERDFRKKRRRRRPLRWQTLVLDDAVVEDALYTRLAMVNDQPFLSLEGLMEDLVVYIFGVTGLCDVVEGLEVVVDEWQSFPQFTDGSHAARSGRTVFLLLEVARDILEDEDVIEDIYREHVKRTVYERMGAVISAEVERRSAFPLAPLWESYLPTM